MAKYYRVKKDHPIWEKGAIISNESLAERYKPVNDLYNRTLDNGETTEGFYESSSLVEHSSEWFERVYPVNVLRKTVYLNRDKARAANEELYKEKK